MAGDDEPPSSLDWDEDEWGGSFLVPPPPPPPSLGSVCSEGGFYCRLEGGGPMGAHFDRASFPSLPIVAVCSSVVLVAVLVASFLFWRHKSKVQNLLPCKTEQQGGCHVGELGAANGVTYEDILAGHHHPSRTHLAGSQTLMPLEILDVKLGDISPSQIPALHHPPCYPSRDASSHLKPPFHHPVYEEVATDKSGKNYEDFESSGKLANHTSEEDFDDGSGQCSATSSVRGSTGGDLCRDPVSSDEGNDCDSYMINNLPKILPGDNSFGYPRQPRQQSNTTYPLPERTAQRESGYRSHSNQPLSDNTKRHVSPPHLRPAAIRPRVVVPPVDPRNMGSAQWLNNHGQQHQSDIGFSASASQENIYSTIDEDEDYPTQPPLTSLACSQRGSSPAGKPNCKGMPARGDGRPIPPPLSQRNPEENGSSYGDIMPAFHSASFM